MEDSHILRAVRIAKYCTGAEIITLGLHTAEGAQATNMVDFEQKLKLISCFDVNEEDVLSDDYQCENGFCHYPSAVDQDKKCDEVKSASTCENIFFMPDSGSFETVVHDIKGNEILIIYVCNFLRFKIF